MDAETAQKARDMLLVNTAYGYPRVHTILPSAAIIGCDWDLEDAEDFIDDAVSVSIADADSLAFALDHKLKVVSGGRTIFFETKPEVERELCGRCFGTKNIIVDSGATPWATEFITIDCPACTGQPVKEGGPGGE